MGVAVTRESLQELGAKLVSRDINGFCESVLAQQPWKAKKPLIVDGVRHVEVLQCLDEMVSPSRNYLIYINVDHETRAQRFKSDPLPHNKTLEELERHPTEVQVRSKLAARAALVLDGTQDADELAILVIEFLNSRLHFLKNSKLTPPA
jgi:hypothetical protein